MLSLAQLSPILFCIFSHFFVIFDILHYYIVFFHFFFAFPPFRSGTPRLSPRYLNNHLLLYLEHDLGKLLVILVSKLVKNYSAKLREEDKTILGQGVGHVYHLLLHDVQAKGDQGWQEILSRQNCSYCLYL